MKMQRQSLRRDDSESRGEKETRNRKSSKVGGTGFCARRKYVEVVKLFVASLISSIARKFQLYRRRGKEDVPHDSKYTGRKRRAIF
jgi:hypothetical protein